MIYELAFVGPSILWVLICVKGNQAATLYWNNNFSQFYIILHHTDPWDWSCYKFLNYDQQLPYKVGWNWILNAAKWVRLFLFYFIFFVTGLLAPLVALGVYLVHAGTVLETPAVEVANTSLSVLAPTWRK